MPRIPQRELRNNVSEVLRRAERGEQFVVTVDGRPVAELGPLTAGRRPASAAALEQILANAPVDPAWPQDLRRMRSEEERDAVDRWTATA